MKSRVMVQVFDDPQSRGARALVRDLQEFMALGEDDRNRCLEGLAGYTLAQTSAETRRLIDELASKCSAERTSLERALSAANFLLGAMVSRDVPADDPELWSDDLAEVGALNEETKPIFVSALATIRQECKPQVQPEARRRRAASAVLPSLKGVDFSVEVRPVKENQYRLGTPARDYEPSFVGITPIASIGIRVDVGTPDRFYFQIDQADADYLIDALEAAKKEMAAFEASLKFNERRVQEVGRG